MEMTGITSEQPPLHERSTFALELVLVCYKSGMVDLTAVEPGQSTSERLPLELSDLS